MENLTVAFIVNVFKPEFTGKPEYSEYCSPETVNGVTTALEEIGNKVILIDAGNTENLFAVLDEIKRYYKEIDLVFSLASGLPSTPSRSRKLMAPALLEHLQVPFTGSSSVGHALATDKLATRYLLEREGVNQPNYQHFHSASEKLNDDMTFPLLVKPASEGSSIGLSQSNVVHEEAALYDRVKLLLRNYQAHVLVEEFLSGTEYTMGIVGIVMFPPLCLDLTEVPEKPLVRDEEVKDIDLKYFRVRTEFDDTYKDIARQTALAHDALGLYDFSRMDFRANAAGIAHFLEANTLAGFQPGRSDLPKEAEYAGISYTNLINMVLYSAIQRYKDDSRFAERFAEKRVAYITERYKETLANADTFEDERLLGKGYTLLKPVH